MSAYGKAHQEVRELYGAEFFAGRSPLVQQSAEAVVPVLMDLLESRSVIDFGCGQGEWLAAFPDDTIKCGVDIAAPDRPWFIGHDLTEPIRVGRPIETDGLYDIVLCVEVGEHLPEEAADTLIDTLVYHGDNVVFGAAVPGQEGTGHINCQPHTYWHDKFKERGFTMHDVINPRIRHDARVSPWYRANMHLYRRSA